MTLNDLECPIHLKVRYIRLLRVSDSTISIGVAIGGRGGSVLEGLAPSPCGQLTRCFSAVAELLILVYPSRILTPFQFLNQNTIVM